MTNDVNHCAFAVTLGPVKPHPNADKLALTEIYGVDIIVGIDAKEGDFGVYFQSELRLSEVFAKANDLIRREDPTTGKKTLGGMFEDNRRVRAQKIRGTVSDGFFIGIDSLAKAGIKTVPKLGEAFQELDKIEVCCKYIPTGSEPGVQKGTQNAPKEKTALKKAFKEHFSTPQLRFKANFINKDRYAVITEKMEGTSGRSFYNNIFSPMPTNWFQKWIINTFGPKGLKINDASTMSRTVEAIGSRRVIIDPTNTEGAFHDPTLRELANKPFAGHMLLGETVYYEIVGFEAGGKSIMPSRDNSKLGKDFVKRYGKTTTFAYNCEPKKFDIYVYRVTFANTDGDTIEYPWDVVEKRCKDWGIKAVPVLWRGLLSNLIGEVKDDRDTGSAILKALASFNGGPSCVDSSHIREGACLRLEGGRQAEIYKDKNDEYKVLAGINNPAEGMDEDAKNEQ